jgi:hypothetical protein
VHPQQASAQLPRRRRTPSMSSARIGEDFARWLKHWAREAGIRPRRLQPSRLPSALRMLAVVTWISAAAMLSVGLIPDAFEAQTLDFGEELQISYTPLWPLMLGIAVGSGAASTGFVYMAARRNAPRHTVVMSWLTGVVTPLIPLLLLIFQRSWQALPVLAVWLLASVLVLFFVHVRRQHPGPAQGLLLSSLVSLTWLPLIYVDFQAALALSGVIRLSNNELLRLLQINLYNQLVVLRFSIAFVAVMAAAGVALVAHARSVTAERIHGRTSDWRITAAVCVAAIAVIALETSGVGGVASGYAEGWWGLRGIGTWPHAVIVAASIVYVTQRSSRQPLKRRGDVWTTIAIGICALAGDTVLAIASLKDLIVGAISGEMEVTAPPVQLDLMVTWLALAAIVPIAVRSDWRDTVGQWVARVGLLYLIPVFAGASAEDSGYDVPFAFWATPVQVVICLIAFGCAAAVMGLMGRNPLVTSNMTSRLVIVPLLIVLGTTWLPEYISTPLTPILAIGGALVTLLWTMPPAAARWELHSGAVLTASAQLLLVTAAGSIVASQPGIEADDSSYALLWFAIPLSALLCARVTAPQPAQKSDSEPTVGGEAEVTADQIERSDGRSLP